MPIYALGADAPEFAARETNWIAPDANLIGKVKLGRNAGIWFGAVLRGDNEPIEIGEDSNVQEHTVMHTDMGFPLTVGKGCTIGHRAMLHGCTIGDNTLIGMGAIVLNGARIGNNCLVGAGALVPPGKRVPAGSVVVGNPFTVLRACTEADLEFIEYSWREYVKRTAQYRAAAGAP